MSDLEEDSESQVPPGVGPPSGLSHIKRRTEPLWIVALVIVSPLIVVLVIYLARMLLH